MGGKRLTAGEKIYIIRKELKKEGKGKASGLSEGREG